MTMTSKYTVKLRLCSKYQDALKMAKYSTGASSASSQIDLVQNSSGVINRKQLDLFSSYKSKLMAARIPRIEKIEVNFLHSGIGDGATLLMNKGLSTPYNCAQHVSATFVKESVLALVKRQDSVTSELIVQGDENSKSSAIAKVDDELKINDSKWIPWDMHRPLEYNCDLKFLKFNMELASPEETALVNKAYWDTSTVVLGAVAQQAFKSNAQVKLFHLPDVDVESGAFCYDVKLSDKLMQSNGKPKWYNDDTSLIELTKVARQIISQNYSFERIEISKQDAAMIFSDNDHMHDRLEKCYKTVERESHVPVYRFGSFFDVIDGPLLPSTSCLFHYVVSAVHRLRSKSEESDLWRFQGLSLPKELQVHHAIWAMLERRAKKLVRKDLPIDAFDEGDAGTPMHKYRSIENRTKRYSIATGQWLEDAWVTDDKSTKSVT